MPDYNHSHSHMTGKRPGHENNMRNMLIVFLVTISIMILEIIGGLVSNSLALLSDAGHMFTDVLAISLSFFAIKFAIKPSTPEKTYGFYRLEILAAFLNGLLLCFIAFYIFYKAFNRFMHPGEINSLCMLGVASIGLLANCFGIYYLSKANLNNLNIRSAFFHMLGDSISSVGVIIGGVWIYYTKLYVVDSLISFMIGFLILRGAFSLLKESIDIFLESTPNHIDQKQLVQEMCQVYGVKGIHHLHIWTITSDIYAISAHVSIDDQLISKSAVILKELKSLLQKKWKMEHITIQFEAKHYDDSINMANS